MKNYEILDEKRFASVVDGKPTALYTLRNKNGLVAQITNFGATIVSLFVPDRNGLFADIVHGLDSIEDYVKHNGPYMGSICGRSANRIAGGMFSLDGKEYQLAVNNGPNHLHGGIKGFDKVVWDVKSASQNQVVFSYFSPDGEEGYPGDLKVQVSYTLNDANELILDYEATTSEPTLINLASHSYFNLAGDGSGKVYDQLLLINADFFTPVDETSIPTGEIRTVKGTPMDYTSMKNIGRDIFADDLQLKYGTGYDHNWVLRKGLGELGLAAIAHDPVSGRTMKIYTTQPGVQFYSSNWTENQKGKKGRIYNKREAFCLETQHFPDAANHKHFPSTSLKPGELYIQKSIHKFSTDLV
ncbi:MAG TPA: aldose epimerase family protein [Bacteroidales bacterium]|nr:aldose epimerase family protein [Bacteroidales bacterium]